MKKLLVTALTIGALISAKAQTEQTFKPFKVDIALGYALPSGSALKEVLCSLLNLSML